MPDGMRVGDARIRGKPGEPFFPADTSGLANNAPRCSGGICSFIPRPVMNVFSLAGGIGVAAWAAALSALSALSGTDNAPATEPAVVMLVSMSATLLRFGGRYGASWLAARLRAG